METQTLIIEGGDFFSNGKAYLVGDIVKGGLSTIKVEVKNKLTGKTSTRTYKRRIKAVRAVDYDFKKLTFIAYYWFTIDGIHHQFPGMTRELYNYLNKSATFNMFGLVTLGIAKSYHWQEKEISDDLLKLIIREEFDSEMVNGVEFK